jgi:hypothetical protein
MNFKASSFIRYISKAQTMKQHSNSDYSLLIKLIALLHLLLKLIQNMMQFSWMCIINLVDSLTTLINNALRLDATIMRCECAFN